MNNLFDVAAHGVSLWTWQVMNVLSNFVFLDWPSSRGLGFAPRVIIVWFKFSWKNSSLRLEPAQSYCIWMNQKSHTFLGSYSIFHETINVLTLTMELPTHMILVALIMMQIQFFVGCMTIGIFHLMWCVVHVVVVQVIVRHVENFFFFQFWKYSRKWN